MSIAVGQVLEGMPDPAHLHRVDVDDQVVIMVGSRVLFCFAASDTGMRNLPLHDFAQNRIWLAVVQLAMELTAWMQLLALSGTDGRRWEPKRLRLRLLWIAGKLARKSRKTWLMLSRDAPWISMFTDAMTRLQTRPAPS